MTKRGRPSKLAGLWPRVEEILKKKGAVGLSELARELGVTPQALRYQIFGKTVGVAEYGGEWGEKLEVIKVGRDAIVALKEGKKGRKSVKVPSDVHKKLKLLAEIEDEYIWEVIAKALPNAAELERKVWYIMKLCMSYGWLRCAHTKGKVTQSDRDQFEKACKQIKERIGVETDDLIANIPKLIENASDGQDWKQIRLATDMIEAVCIKILTQVPTSRPSTQRPRFLRQQQPSP